MSKRVRKPKDILRPKEFEALLAAGGVQIYMWPFEDGFQIFAQKPDGAAFYLGMSRGPLMRTFKRFKTAAKWLESRGHAQCPENAKRVSAAKADRAVKKMKEERDRFMAEPGNEELKARMLDIDAGMPMPEYDFEEVARQSAIAEKATNGLLREVQEKAKRRAALKKAA